MLIQVLVLLPIATNTDDNTRQRHYALKYASRPRGREASDRRSLAAPAGGRAEKPQPQKSDLISLNTSRLMRMSSVMCELCMFNITSIHTITCLVNQVMTPPLPQVQPQIPDARPFKQPRPRPAPFTNLVSFI